MIQFMIQSQEDVCFLKKMCFFYLFFFIYFYQLEANYFTILQWVLSYIDMNQPWIFFKAKVYYQFWPRDMWDLYSWPGIEPMAPALEVQSLDHWTSREDSKIFLFFFFHNSHVASHLSPIHFNYKMFPKSVHDD